MTGADIFIQALRRNRVEVVFGYPGAAIVDILDRIETSPIRHVLVRHEQGAVHAADGYARAGGNVGVVLVTSGPGATNTVTGIATAYKDSIPLVVITGQVPTHLIGNDAFQEVDIVGITLPCTKHNILVKSVEDLPRRIDEAFRLAMAGRPGPVLVDIPKNVLGDDLEGDPDCLPEGRPLRAAVSLDIEKLAAVVDAITRARDPVILVGGGVLRSRAVHELKALIAAARIPVAVTLMGLSAVETEHPLYLGVVGPQGDAAANARLVAADLILAVGVRFSNRLMQAADFSSKRLIHLDADAILPLRAPQMNLAVEGDAAPLLNALTSALSQRGSEPVEAFEAVETRSLMPNATIAQRKGCLPTIEDVLDALNRGTHGAAILSVDASSILVRAAGLYRFKDPYSFIFPGGLGCSGFGLPAALGAKLARPERTVLNLTDPIHLQYNVQEIMTAVQHCIPIKVFVLNAGKHAPGSDRDRPACLKTLRFGEGAPDFMKLAEAFGAEGVRINGCDGMEALIAASLSIARPVVFDVRVDG